MAQTSNFDTPQHLQEVEERLLEEKWRPQLENKINLRCSSKGHPKSAQHGGDQEIFIKKVHCGCY